MGIRCLLEMVCSVKLPERNGEFFPHSERALGALPQLLCSVREQSRDVMCPSHPYTPSLPTHSPSIQPHPSLQISTQFRISLSYWAARLYARGIGVSLLRVLVSFPSPGSAWSSPL